MTEASDWQVRTSSVRGASHIRSGAPNEDATGWYRSPDGALTIVAVGDGHGSQRSFRSDIGSALAVEIGLDVLGGIMRESASGSRPELDEAVGTLPGAVLERWRAAVRDHASSSPVTPAELARAGIEGDLSEKDLEVAYGTTLLMVAVTPHLAVATQLGDGDILWRTDDGVGRLIDRPREATGDATFSLASGRLALAEWQTKVVDWDRPPDLILLATDGYANSFPDEAGFLAVASDLHDHVQAHGLDAVAASLPGWLREATRNGSGDDISVGLLVPGSAVSTTNRASTPAPASRGSSERALLAVGGLCLLAGMSIGWVVGGGPAGPTSSPSPGASSSAASSLGPSLAPGASPSITLGPPTVQ